MNIEIIKSIKIQTKEELIKRLKDLHKEIEQGFYNIKDMDQEIELIKKEIKSR